MARVRFIMLGGFLGAGKTTAIARLARHYTQRGLRVGLVTNDQAFGLVDTQSLRAQGFNVGEVTGACFCCKFNDLVDAVRQLAAAERPEVIIAEPVGSCTDLVATVIEPLKRYYNDYDIAPYAVLLKPEHGLRIMCGDAGAAFSSNAAYIFLKQLEEADVVVINKVDKLSPDDRARLTQSVADQFPDKQVLTISARSGENFEALIAALDAPGPQRDRTPDVDYDIYAEGEAELGWLNCTLKLWQPQGAARGEPFEIDLLLIDYVRRLQRACAAADAEPAHLKVLASDRQQSAIANLVSSGVDVELSVSAGTRASEVELTVNARMAVAPETLSAIVAEQAAALARDWNLAHELSEVQSFRPGRPVPTHRIALGQGS